MQTFFSFSESFFDIMTLDTPQQRLEAFINKRFKSKTEFAKKIGILPQSLNRYVNNAKYVFRDYNHIEKLKETGLNIDWYLNGEGDMLDSDTPQSRLKRFIAEKYGTQKAFADALGETPVYLNHYTNGEGVFSNYTQINKLRKLGLNPEWYRDGVGSMEYMPLKEIDNKEVNDFLNFVATIPLYSQLAYANTSTIIPTIEEFQIGKITTDVGMKVNSPKSFGAIQVSGNSMVNFGIVNGSKVVFNRDLQPRNNNIIVAILNGHLLIKQYVEKNGKVELHSADGHTIPIVENMDDDCQVIGVVTSIIQQLI